MLQAYSGRLARLRFRFAYFGGSLMESDRRAQGAAFKQ